MLWIWTSLKFCFFGNRLVRAKRLVSARTQCVLLIMLQFFPFLFLINFFPKKQILDFSKLKEFTDDNFKFDENGRKFSNRVENTVEIGEIAA